MTNEEIKKLIQDRIKTLASEVIVSNNNIQWLGRCLSFLNQNNYCIVKYHNTFQIQLSRFAIEEIVALMPENRLIYHFDDIRSSIEKDRDTCNTVIKVLSSLESEKESEEENKIKKRIALEEDERAKYRRHY